MKRTFHFAIGGVFGKEALCCRSGRLNEEVRRRSCPRQLRAAPPKRPCFPPPEPRPPPRSSPRFLTLAAAPAPCRGTPAPCGVSCGGVQAGTERAGGGARARVRRGGRTYLRSARRGGRDRVAALPSCRRCPASERRGCRPPQVRAARPRPPGCGGRSRRAAGGGRAALCAAGRLWGALRWATVRACRRALPVGCAVC